MIGAFKLNSIGKFTVTAVAEVIRLKKGITAVGDAKVSTAQSKFGGASAVFDGSGDYLIGQSTLISGTGDFTIEMQVRFNSTGAAVLYDQRTFNSGNFTQNSPVLFWENSRVIYFNSSNRITSAQTLSTSVWYHLAISRSSGVSRLFIDGTQSSGNFNDTINNPSTGVFGIGINLPGLFTSFNGHMDEIRISNTARYTANFTAPTAAFVNDDNTLLLIHCDGTNASTFFEDDNGVRHRSTINAGPGFSLSTTQSKFGGTSLTANGGSGTNNSLLQNIDLTGVTTFTEEMWVYFTSVTNESSYGLIHWFGGSARRIYAVFTGSEANRFYYAAGAFYFWNFTWSANTWYHIAVTRDSSNNVNAYINGSSLGASQNITGAHFTAGYTGAWFGSFEGSINPIRGFIDEFRFSDNVRYTANFTPPTTAFTNDINTRALYHFDGTNASTVFRDDNGVRSQKGVQAINNAKIDTAQSKFGGSSATFPDATSAIISQQLLPSTSNDFTFECWFRGDWSGDDPALPLSLYHQLATPNGFSVSISTARLINFFYRNEGNITLSTTTQISKGVWYHYSAVRQGSSLKVFFNGVEEGSNTLTVFVPGEIGSTIGNASGLNRQFFGHIDEFRISNTARYTANFTPATQPFQNDSNTLLLLHMDGTNSSTVFIDDNGRTTTP
jgi:hypothetical protein